jgi:hypothetical protein
MAAEVDCTTVQTDATMDDRQTQPRPLDGSHIGGSVKGFAEAREITARDTDTAIGDAKANLIGWG